MIPALLFKGICFAQLPVPDPDLAEELLYQDGTGILPPARLEELEDQLLQGLNINTAEPEELISSGLFTPFQAQILIEYREQFGPLWSVHELDVLPGFRGSAVERIKPILYTATPNPPGTGRSRGGLLMIDASRTIPLSRGYFLTDPSAEAAAYPGSPWKSSMRFRTRSYRGITMAVSYEKDAGERILDDNRPEYLAGYAHLCSTGTFRELIAGNFRLGQGMGLVCGTGFMHVPDQLSVNRSSLSAIRPSASLSNTGTGTGLAARIETQHMRILAWTSYREHDLSPEAVRQGEDPFGSIRETGLHRTPGEREGRSLGYRFHTGVQVLAWSGDLTLGALAAVGLTGLTARGSELTGLTSPPDFFQVYSVHWLWQKRGLETFGELALREPGVPATISGLRYRFSDFLQGLLLFHHYAPGYRGIEPSAYASGSRPENEYGMALSFQAEPGRSLVATFNLEYFRYPAPRYLVMIPSWSTRIGATFQSTGRGNFLWKFRVVNQTWQSTPHQEDLNHRPLVTLSRLRSELRLDHHPSRTFSWQSRMILSKLTGTGFAAAQQFRVSGSRCTTTFQFVAFHVEEWENRIYLYEPGPLYSFSFPPLYGKGQKVAGQFNWKPLDRLTLTCKVSHTMYLDRDYIGSGNDLTEGNRRWQMHLQARLGF